MKSTSTKGATARALNKLMEEVDGHREAKLVQTIALRSMMKAKYSTHNIGHFGLAFDYYTLHVAHTPLSRHHGAPTPHPLSGRRTVGQQKPL